MAGTETTVTDDYGRRVVFKGEQLVSETTDTEDRRKPQWVDLDVWKTEAGAFIVRRATCHRVVHADQNCSRAAGYDLRSSSKDDTVPCRVCNTAGATDGWAVYPRVTVDVYTTPREFIDSLAVDGRYTRLARAILAEVSEQDDRVDALWNTVHVK